MGYIETKWDWWTNKLSVSDEFENSRARNGKTVKKVASQRWKWNCP